ncbi:hypothetical protein F5Y13DRAFT_186122 [Hypoxylon sp. FL1857]|nr:hypothetical protein F5Y13DRAFT_186122 [Hypoxylon sp. FL1857]
MTAYEKRAHPHQRQYGWGPDWQDGDIAFLKGLEEFNKAEYDALIGSRYLHPKATQHPVIILEHTKDYRHFLVTTVSAYSSSWENRFRPPWEQDAHRNKRPEDFRAFYGSEKPCKAQRHLQLANGGCFPKPQTSWVYTRGLHVVPSSALKAFDKANPRLQMEQTSLKDLLDHIKKHPGYASRWTHDKVLQMLEPRKPKTRRGSGSKESPNSAASSDRGSVATSSSVSDSDSEPSTPKSPTKMTWAGIARAAGCAPVSIAVATTNKSQSVR